MQVYLWKCVAVFLAQLLLLPPLPPAKAQFDLVSQSSVVSEGDTLVFLCIYNPGQFIEVEWYLNNTLYNNVTFEGVYTELAAVSFIGILSILRAALVHNNTRIRCVGSNAQGSQFNSTDSVAYVQGELPPVKSLSLHSTNSVISINWTDPFIPEVYPEISNYCVTVTINSAGNFTTLHSTCSLNQTEFYYPTPPNVLCETVDFSVGVMNSLGNGSRSTVSYFPRDEAFPELIEFSLTQSIAVLSYPLCDAEVKFEDIHTGEIIALLDTDVNIRETNITFSARQLKENRRYNVTITAFTTIISSARVQIEASTHDILHLTVTVNSGNTIQVTAKFVENSDATGAFILFVLSTNMTLDHNTSYFMALSKTLVSSGSILPFDLRPGLYEVYAYDIERSGTLQPGTGYPARRSSVMVTQREDARHHNMEVSTSCNVTSRDRVIAANCAFKNLSSVLGFQIVVQVPDIDSFSVLHVNTSMDPLVPATLKVPTDGEYLVTVLPILVGTGILSGMALSQTHVVGVVPIIQKNNGTASLRSLPVTAIEAATEPSNSLEIIIGSLVGAVIMVALGVALAIMIVKSSLKSRQRRKILQTNLKVFIS